MTFATLPDQGADIYNYYENGINATGVSGALAYDTAPGSAHIDDSGTGMTSMIDFTMGGTFDALSFDVTSLGYNFWGTPGPLSDNLFVTGYVGGTAVSMASYILNDIAGSSQTYTLGSAFAGIDRLRIELAYPTNSQICDAPCAHFDLDNVVLNGLPGLPPAVPLPATAALAAAGIGALSAVRRRRRR